MPLRYWLETYGCQMNFAESNALEYEFATAGLVPALDPEEADIAVLNTCSVRQTAENRIWGRLGYFQHLKDSRELKVILTGCMAERLADDIKKKSPAVDFVVGTNDKQELLSIIQELPVERDGYYHFKNHYQGKKPAKTLLPIMNGCNNFCTYCIVPYVRGREISRDPDAVCRELEALKGNGLKEVTLLGQNVNSYDYEGVDFPTLLSRISDLLSDDIWIRFLSPHPKDFSPQLISLIAERKNICSHVHLPVQSGADAMLSAMKRRYTRTHYLDLVGAMRSADPDITFSTDILVGFPGESEDDFNDTLSLVKEVKFLDAFMYYFNPREGTKAMEMDNHLDDELKLSRLRTLIGFQREQALEIKKTRLGRRERVLVEGVSKKDPDALLARSEHDEIVIIPQSNVLLDEFADVTISRLTGTTYRGEL